MDWNLAIEKNRDALKRILAMLVAMVGFPVSGVVDVLASGARDVRVGPPTLPRHLHRLTLRLLRPAEAATRRLIFVAARGLVVGGSFRQGKPRPSVVMARSRLGIAMVLAPGMQVSPPVATRHALRNPSLPLFDPLKRWRRAYVKRRGAPRISFFDADRPREPEPLPPMPDDMLVAGRVIRRLEALAVALNDLPRQAHRLARWQARRSRQDAENHDAAAGPNTANVGRDSADARAKVRALRFSPMRPGRPPGWRRRPNHPVYEVLNELHGLAVWSRERPDTS